MENSGTVIDRRTFLGGFLSLEVGSLLPRQSLLGIDEYTEMSQVEVETDPVGAMNYDTAIGVGNAIAVGSINGGNDDGAMTFSVYRGETSLAFLSEAPRITGDPTVFQLAHDPSSGYYVAGVAETGDSGDGHAAYLGRCQNDRKSLWFERIRITGLDTSLVSETPVATVTTADGGVVVAGTLEFYEPDEGETGDDDEGQNKQSPSTRTPSTDTPSTVASESSATPTNTTSEPREETGETPSPSPTPATPDETATVTEEQRRVAGLSPADVAADGRDADFWVVKYDKTADRVWQFTGRLGDSEILSLKTNSGNPRLLLHLSGREFRNDQLVQMTFDDEGSVNSIDTNTRFDGHDGIDSIDDGYRGLVEMEDGYDLELVTFEDDLTIRDRTDPWFLEDPEGALVLATDDGSLLRGTRSRFGIERTVIAKYGPGGEHRWTHAFSEFDTVPQVVELTTGYGLVGPRNRWTGHATVVEGDPTRFWGLLGSALLAITLITMRTLRGGDDSE